MCDPSIEFVIPFYGDPGYLRETVTSLLAQEDEAWTATVIDDCYPDPAVGSWVRSLDDERLQVRRNQVNLGANRTYRLAVELASADYVVVLGADDRLLPGYVGRARAVARQFAPAVLQPGVRVIGADGRPAAPRVDRVKTRLRPQASPSGYRGEGLARGLLLGNWTYFPSLCWDRRALVRHGFRDYDVVQDLALLLDVVMAGGRVAVDSEVTFEYRRHAGSDSAVRSLRGSRFAEERHYFASVAGELDRIGWHRAARSARLHLTSRAHAATLLPTAVRRRDLGSAAGLARHAVGS